MRETTREPFLAGVTDTPRFMVRTVGSHLRTVLHLVAGFQKFTARNLSIVVFRITGPAILFASHLRNQVQVACSLNRL